MSRTTFTTRLDGALVDALDARVRAESRSRNWGIEQAVRDWLDRAAADDTPTPTPPGVVHKTRDDARAAGAGTVQGAPPPQPPPEPVGEFTAETTSDAVMITPRHLHRFEKKVPDTDRGIGGVMYAMYRCSCGREVERKVPK